MDWVGDGVLRVQGSVGFPDSEGLLSMLLEALASGREVVVDLSGAESLDSRALTGLAEASLRARELGTVVHLERMSESAARIIQMSGLASTFGLVQMQMEHRRTLMNGADLRRQDWRITESVVLAETELIADLREMAVEAARSVSADSHLLVDVRLAVGETLVNALLHGSTGPRSKIRLRCLTCPRAFVAEVIDQGGNSAWSDPDSEGEGAGLGMKLIRAAMDEVGVAAEGSGLKVRMLKWLPEGASY